MLTPAAKRTTSRFGIVVTAIVILAAAPSPAQRHHEHASDAAAPRTSSKALSSDKPFAELLHEAMAAMDRGMREAPMNGVAEHDFISMMIPHHQGAIDMAKALLLTTKDPELRNLAQGIITEQQNEIRLMRAWLDHHAERRR